MTKTEMLIKLLKQSGWDATNDADEDGRVIVVAAEAKAEVH